MKISVRTTLLPPVPLTRLTVRVNAGDTMTLASLICASGHSQVTVAWGDGNATTAPGGKFAHTYEAAGVYEITISDDIQTLTVVGPDEAAIASAPFVVGFTTDARLLNSLNSRAFEGCVNLTNLMLDAAMINALLPATFGSCLSLTGKLWFPSVTMLPGPGMLLPFMGCTGGITEIHFAASSEESIKSSKAYVKDPTLGTGTAILKFDL